MYTTKSLTEKEAFKLLDSDFMGPFVFSLSEPSEKILFCGSPFLK